MTPDEAIVGAELGDGVAIVSGAGRWAGPVGYGSTWHTSREGIFRKFLLIRARHRGGRAHPSRYVCKFPTPGKSATITSELW